MPPGAAFDVPPPVLFNPWKHHTFPPSMPGFPSGFG
jgi:hypothetical protein